MTVITVKTIPGSSRNEVVGWEIHGDDRILKIKITAQPEKGKANKALIEVLAKHFKCSKTNIELVRGTTNRLKTFKIQTIKDKL